MRKTDVKLEGWGGGLNNVHLTRQVAHDGEGGHVQSNARAGRELKFVNLAAAAHNIPRTAACLHNDCKPHIGHFTLLSADHGSL